MLLATLPIWALAILLAWQDVAGDVAAGRAAAAEAARRGAVAVERALADQKGLLDALAATDDGDHPALVAVVAGWPRAAQMQLVLADAAGRVLAGSGGGPTPVADRALNPASALPAPAQAALVAAALSGTTQVSSQFRLGTDAPAETVLAIPTPGPTRLALGLLSEGVAFWSAVLRAADPPPGATVALIDRDGVIVARQPDPAAHVGSRARRDTQESLFALGQARSGIGNGTDSAGVSVESAWQQLDAAPWAVVVAWPATQAAETYRAALLPVVGIGALLALAATLAGASAGEALLGRPLRRLALAAAPDAATPDNTPQGPIAELACASRALASSATLLAARDAEAATLAKRLHTVLDSTTDCIMGIDAGGRIRWMNSRAGPLLGDLAISLIGRELLGAFPGFAEGVFADAFRAAMQDRVTRNVTGWHEHLQRWISAEAYPGEDGGLTIFFRDAGSQRTSEEAVRESEARLRAVLDHIPLGVLLAEAPSGRVLLGNRRLEEILGQSLGSLGDVTTEQLLDTFQPDGRRLDPADTPLGQTLASGASASRELLYRRQDGSTTWLRASAAPIRDANGQMTGAVMAVSDVAVERRAAEALRESELRFRTLAEAVPQIVWSARPDGSVDYVNPRFTEFTGRPAHEASLPGSPVLHPEDAPAVRTAWVGALAAGRAFAAEYRMRGADGSWRWFAARALPARGPEGAVRRWIGAATDVTDLIAAREALQVQVLAEANARAEAVANALAFAVAEERFRRFGSASPDVLWITEAAGARVEYVSPAFERIWGAGCAALMADPALWTRMIHPEDRDRVEAARGAAPGADAAELEYRVLRADGQERWIRDRAFPIADAAGAPYARGGIARDVTEAKAAEARQRLLIGELNHRVKNTLATVHSLSLQTARGHVAKAEAEAALPRDPSGQPGAPATVTMTRFVRDLQARIMALSRAHDLLTATTWQGATLRETVRSALSPWLPGTPEETTRITYSGPAAWLAPKQALGLALALHELATNAAKHGGLSVAEGRVSVRWRRSEAGAVTLCWKESGGPPVSPPTRRGFGTRLLERGLAGELGEGASVALDYAPAGFGAKIIFLLPAEGLHDHDAPERAIL